MRLALPSRVNVVETDIGGPIGPGIRLRNRSTRPAVYLEADQPTRVYLNSQNEYAVEYWITSRRNSGEPVPPGYVSPAKRGTESVPVIYGPLPTPEQHTRVGWALNWQADANTYPPGHQAEVAAVLVRVKSWIELILSLESGQATVTFYFQHDGANGGLGSTDSQGATHTVTQIRDKLVSFCAADDESEIEAALYDSLPNGGSVPVIFENNTTVQISTVKVPSAINGKWYSQQATADGDIEFNIDKPWDWNPKDGIDPDKRDFEGALRHELLHALGYDCLMERVPHDQICPWDLFRLRNSDAGSGISAANFPSKPRSLQPGVEAVGVSALSSSERVYRLSTGVAGDGAQSNHWKDVSLFGSWIGLMNPVLTLGQAQHEPGYASIADLRAMDTMGWNIDLENQGPPAPIAPDLQHPAPGQQHSSLTPTLDWTVDGTTETSDLYIFIGTAPEEATLVYSVADTTSLSQTVPYGTLTELTTYTWLVTASNGVGFAYSEQRTFTTTCYANCDASTTAPVLNVQDFSCFLARFASGDPYANCDGSTTAPVLNVQDFSCFQTKFASGCS
jgi:hypothetical protein